jgi:hypothetical protein
MSWEIYDKTKFVDDLGSSNNIRLLTQLGYSGVNSLLNIANSEKGADKNTVDAAIEELSNEAEWMWLADILKRCTPPVRLSDGTEDWLPELYPNEDWEEPE